MKIMYECACVCLCMNIIFVSSAIDLSYVMIHACVKVCVKVWYSTYDNNAAIMYSYVYHIIHNNNN